MATSVIGGHMAPQNNTVTEYQWEPHVAQLGQQALCPPQLLVCDSFIAHSLCSRCGMGAEVTVLVWLPLKAGPADKV